MANMALRRLVPANFRPQILTPSAGQLVYKCNIHTTIPLGYNDDDPYETKRYTLANAKGQFEIAKMPKYLLEKEYNRPNYIDQFRQKYPGFWIDQKFHYVREMDAELIVPDLTDFKLKPYVSYRVGDLDQPPLTAKDIFDNVYAPEVLKRAEGGKPIKVRLSARDIHMARIKAQQTGTDLMSGINHYGVGSDYWPTHAPRMWIARRRNPRPNNDLVRVNS